jgi:plasmid stabilization system protein ParE
VTWRVRFTGLADEDIAETYAHYETARRGLGEEFLDDLARAIETIGEFPERSAEVHRRLRRALLRRFPYSLYYRLVVDAQTVEVRACVHQRRHPRTWRRRA